MTLSQRIQQAIYSLLYAGSFIFFWWIASIIGFPTERGHGGSLLGAQGIFSAMIDVVTAVVLVPVVAFSVRGGMGKSHWHSLGLTVATAGLSAWSMRGGAMRDILLYADSASIFIRLAFETIILGVVLGAVWLMLWNQPHDGELTEPANVSNIATTVAIATIVFAVVTFVLVQTDAKKQCTVSLFLAGMVSASVIRANWPENGTGRWLFLPPILVGLLGYAFASFAAENWANGPHDLTGWLVPLARPLPLDYASAGIFGMLIGYWMNIPETEEDVEPGELTPSTSPTVI